MIDVLTPEQRRYCMSRIHGKNTKPEVMLRKALWAQGLRYRLKNDLYGKPDIVFASQRVAIFIDGCFWHRCKKHFVLPKTNRKLWDAKINSNVERDRFVQKILIRNGWSVLRIWEHEINDHLDKCVLRIKRKLLK